MAPLVFLIRHGQTDWSKTGQYTGKTEKRLTEDGRKEAITLGDKFVGAGKHIDMLNVVHIFVSPRVRARETFELLIKDVPEAMEKAVFSEEFSEWDHGDYEGLTTEEIRALRANKGLDSSSTWSIWTGGCQGGESVEEMTIRVKQARALVEDVMKDHMGDKKPGNIIIVGHGTFLRCFWKIWHGFPIEYPLGIKFETGTIATLRYEDRDDRSVAEHFNDQTGCNIGIRDVQPRSE